MPVDVDVIERMESDVDVESEVIEGQGQEDQDQDQDQDQVTGIKDKLEHIHINGEAVTEEEDNTSVSGEEQEQGKEEEEDDDETSEEDEEDDKDNDNDEGKNKEHNQTQSTCNGCAQPQYQPQSMTWSWTAPFKERQMQMLKFGFFHDFTLVLGDKEPKAKVNVHKAIIASSSSILYKEVLRVLGEGVNVLELKEDPSIFTLLLEFVYTGDTICSFKDAFALQKLGRKYLIPGLVLWCDNVIIKEQFTLDCVYKLLPFAHKSSHEALIHALFHSACIQGAKFVADDRFLHLSAELVQQFVDRDDLYVKSEMDVVRAVVRWGQYQCKIRNPELTHEQYLDPSYFGSLIEGIVNHLRFPVNWAMLGTQTLKSSKALKSSILAMKDIKYNQNCRLDVNPISVTCSRLLMGVDGLNKRPRLTLWGNKKVWFPFCESLQFKINCPFKLYCINIIQGVFGEQSDTLYDYSDVKAIAFFFRDNPYTPPQCFIRHDNVSKDPRIQIWLPEPLDIPPNVWVTVTVTLDGVLKHRLRHAEGSDFSRTKIKELQPRVASQLSISNVTSYVMSAVEMTFPVSCEFQRPPEQMRLPGERMAIDKGIIESLNFCVHSHYPGPGTKPDYVPITSLSQAVRHA